MALIVSIIIYVSLLFYTSIHVGLDLENDDSYYPYYEIMLNDDTSIDFFGGSTMNESNKGFEEVLTDFDRKLRGLGITKSVNKDNFEKYAEGLDKEFTKRKLLLRKDF